MQKYTWSNRQIWLWSTEWSRAKANRVLPRECTGHSKHLLLTAQEKTYIWTSADDQHQNQIDYILCSQRWRSSIKSAKTRPGADFGCWSWTPYAKLNKVGKIIRQCRHDLNQIPNEYTVEVRKRFKGLNLINRVLDELWMEVCDIIQETGSKTIPMEKKCKKAKWLSGEALEIAVQREVKSKGEKERYKHLNAEFKE